MIKTFLKILSMPSVSRTWGRLVRIRKPRFLIKRLVRFYAKTYNIDMDEYEGSTDDYNCLSDFFIRPLDLTVRPLTKNEAAFVSPSDGVLTEMETIHEDKATQIKGKTYSVSELVKRDLDFSKGWHVAIIYLSPSNYHRYHYPTRGRVENYFHTGGRLYPVNHMGLNNVESLFVKNDRIITEIRKDDFTYYYVAVGATNVGSIKMEFIEGEGKQKAWEPVDSPIDQLQEAGRFEMGSTIVLVLPKDMAEPITEKKGQSVRVGEPLLNLA
ncbi:MAG: phosphatidylserine decarboxylase [bacterium]|nr:phosphatidylserine decarboxylase [bacterium]